MKPENLFRFCYEKKFKYLVNKDKKSYNYSVKVY